MRFNGYLNEEVKLQAMKVKKALDLVLGSKFFSDKKDFRTGSISYILQLPNDHSANQSAVKPYIKKVVKKIEDFGFTKTEEHPENLKWKNADQIWSKDNLVVLIYLAPPGKVTGAYFYITVFDMDKKKKADDLAAEKTRKWVVKNSSMMD